MTALEPRRPIRHPVLALLVALLVGGLLAGTLAVSPVSAASDQLRLAIAATYRVDPAKQAVHVTLDVSATNQKPDTATTIYYYSAVSLAAPFEAKTIRATSNGSKLTVSTTAHKTFREVTVHFANLYHGKTRKIRLTWDLPSGKPRSDSPIRVGKAHVAFSAWAWGDPGLGDVRIVMPPHFIGGVRTDPSDADAQLASSSVNGRTVYTVRHLDDPVGWYSSIEASDRDALTDVPITAADEPVVIHAWPEDADWQRRVSTVLKDSLPDLKAAIGLPWPVEADLDIIEVTSSEIDGYAGFFDSSDHQITISEDLDDMVIVHEASHAWFGGALFQGRWIGEGLANEYASRVLAGDHPDDLSHDPASVSATDPVAFDLDTWRPPIRIDADSDAYEAYGYDASWAVIRAIVDEVTEPRMRDVFKAASAQTLTYVGAGPAESAGFVPDWRRFLDIVTDVGGSTKAEGLLETWVLTPKEDAELPARDASRERYFALVTAGDGWLPGIVIRKPMSNWRFAEAETAMDAAEPVLSARDALTAATTDLGLAFPDGFESAYETADTTDDLAALGTRIADRTAAAAALRTARDDLARGREPLVALGLYDSDPSAGYDAALAAFAAGDDKAVLAGAGATVAALAGAEAIGRGRATTAGVAAAVVLLLLVLVLVVFVVRRRRRRRGALVLVTAASAAAPAEPAAVVVAPDPYATLAATPDLVDEDPAGEPGARGAEPD